MATCRLRPDRGEVYAGTMLLWVILALMTGAAVLTVLWPLSRTATPAEAANGDVLFYKAQLSEIERDKDRGLIGPGEAEAARAEAGRRLLRAAGARPEIGDATSEPALRRRRAASAMALSVVPIVGLALYGGLGSPHLGDQPAAARLPAARPNDVASALGRVEEHLARNPDDARGWEIVAPIYLRLGRFDDAARAYREAVRLGGETPDRLVGLAEALIGTRDGNVGSEAAAVLNRAVALDPALPPARYYLGLAAEQAGDYEAARERYRGLVRDAKPEAPWLSVVQARLARLDPAAPPAALPPASVTPEIAAMVSGLDERLKTGGGSEAEWTRLIRSFVVLGRQEEARDRLGRARLALARDDQALSRFDGLARELGLSAEIAGR